MSQVKTFDYEDDNDEKKTMEVITIPVSYHIRKERMEIPKIKPYGSSKRNYI